MQKLIETIANLIKDVIKDNNITDHVITYQKVGNDNILSILINKENGVDLDDCVKVSEEIGKILDKSDPIKEEYMLEVASIGAERPLTNKSDFVNAIDKYILVHTNTLIKVASDGYDELVGFLRSVNETSIVLEVKVKTRTYNITINDEDIIDAMTTVNI